MPPSGGWDDFLPGRLIIRRLDAERLPSEQKECGFGRCSVARHAQWTQSKTEVRATCSLFCFVVSPSREVTAGAGRHETKTNVDTARSRTDGQRDFPIRPAGEQKNARLNLRDELGVDLDGN